MKVLRTLTIVVLVSVGAMSEPRVLRAEGSLFSNIDYPKYDGGWTSGINALGDIVGDYQDKAGGYHGYLRDALGGAYRTIDDPMATHPRKCKLIDNQGNVSDNGTDVQGIGPQGDIVGSYVALGSNCLGQTYAFVLHRGSFAFTTLRYPKPVDNHGVVAIGINGVGEIVGTVSDYVGVERGFQLKHGAFTAIEYPGYVTDLVPTKGILTTEPASINDAGDIVGKYEFCPQENSDAGCTYHGFLRHKGVFSTIDDPLAAKPDPSKKDVTEWGTEATGINGFGTIVGYYVDHAGNTHGFLLKHGRYFTIDNPQSMHSAVPLTPDGGVVVSSTISGMNDQGDIVGNYTEAGGTGHGFLLSGQALAGLRS